ncbi:YebC/PmpR family DNA-binding transcriptional regulator [candidate division TA06 bacterium]|uniref:Probable transcriptional regulatory protein E3J62_06925 n=1 Tax=candidate division TA06 bacterium TaxID=2250710 RepID=A0A523UTH2_UNCT6|nr:MAG: YebC/PmpR family DNA-binding transcriptional regulator [candidate division TA06 bacterium]
MSGHSKWSTIKRKKGKADAQRGKIFSKLIKEITVAAREGGGDPEGNRRLRTAIAMAKAANMPAQNVERAIKRGTGELPGVSYEEVSYEGYGPGGTAMLVDCMTDNRNRTTADVRKAFSKHGGSLGSAGCVSWIFSLKGVIMIDKSKVDEDTLLSVALEAGADDVGSDANTYEIVTDLTNFEQVKKSLENKKIEYTSAERTKVPQSTVKLTGKKAEQMLRLIEAIEELDDVQDVYANFDIPEEVMVSLAG